MLSTAIIVFREVLEAALIIGIVLAATTDLAQSRRYVAYGVANGVLGAIGFACFADALSSALEGTGQDIFNASVLSIAILMLAWHNIWMSRHGREMAMEMAAAGRRAVEGESDLRALSIVVAIAVLREGSETVLFLYGIAASGNGGVSNMAWGLFLGTGMGAIVGSALYLGLLRIPHRHLFAVTGKLVTLLAAGMAAQTVTFLSSSGLITITDTPVWDSSNILSDQSIVGRMLHILAGYIDRPNAVQLAAWVLTIAVITTLTALLTPQAPRQGDQRAI